LLALLGSHHILHISRIKVKVLIRILKFNLFLKIPMGYASADFSGWFLLKDKLCKMFAVILSTKCKGKSKAIPLQRPGQALRFPRG
jgi:hypothetical protein